MNDIYTIDVEGKEVNVQEELRKCELLEQVYSVIEQEGNPEGETYFKYNKYLKKVRDKKNKMIEEKGRIKEENASEINNINVLLKSMKKHLEIVENKSI